MKRLLLFVSMICMTATMWAGQITREQALRQAQQFLNQKGHAHALMQAETPLSKARARGKQSPDYYYVFNSGNNQGFVIVSGDDRTPAILGYSESGTFDVSTIPVAMEALLEHYASQIELIQNGAQPSPQRASHASVEPIVSAKWNQGEPYNGKAMLGYYTNGNTFRCVTGCVATAMAQVLYTQKFVNATTDEIPGYQNPTYYSPATGYMDAIPAGSTLDWGNMVDTYTGSETDAQKEAVADLMLYCATSVEMSYTKDASSASVSNIPDALKNYFGYSRGTRYVQRKRYSEDEWDNLIYNEIASGRPVIYGGQTVKDEGHAFIVHGYADGKFLINWGWGGYCDNYFLLDDLTPADQGIGGGTKGEGYNYTQDAVIHLEKEDGTFTETVNATVEDAFVGEPNFSNFKSPTGTEYTASRSSAESGVNFSIAIQYTSYLANTYTFDFGYGVTDADGKLVGEVAPFANSSELKQNHWFTPASGTSAFGQGLAAGTYYVKGYSREKGTTDWLLCDDADKYAIEMIVTSTSMAFKVVDISKPDPTPEVTDEDRAALSKIYADLKTVIEEKQKTVTDNEKDLTAMKADIDAFGTKIEELTSRISTVEEALNTDLLSDEQKTEFSNQLEAFKKELDAYSTSHESTIKEYTSLTEANNELKANLATALEELNKEASEVSGIETTEALEALKAKAENLETQVKGYDTEALKKSVLELKSALSTASLTETELALETIEENVSKAIEEAKKLAELEAAKNAMQEPINALKKGTEDENGQLTAANSVATEIADAIKEGEEKLNQLIKTSAEIEDALAGQGLTDDQRATFKAQLDELNKTITKLSDQLDDLKKAKASIDDKLLAAGETIQTLVKDTKELETQLAAADAIETVNSLQDDLKALQQTLEDVNTDLEGVSTDMETATSDAKAMVGDVETALTVADTLLDEVKYTATGIGGIAIDENDIIGRYDLNGKPVDKNYRGIMIIRMNNGKTKAIIKR